MQSGTFELLIIKDEFETELNFQLYRYKEYKMPHIIVKTIAIIKNRVEPFLFSDIFFYSPDNKINKNHFQF